MSTSTTEAIPQNRIGRLFGVTPSKSSLMPTPAGTTITLDHATSDDLVRVVIEVERSTLVAKGVGTLLSEIADHEAEQRQKTEFEIWRRETKARMDERAALMKRAGRRAYHALRKIQPSVETRRAKRSETQRRQKVLLSVVNEFGLSALAVEISAVRHGKKFRTAARRRRNNRVCRLYSLGLTVNQVARDRWINLSPGYVYRILRATHAQSTNTAVKKTETTAMMIPIPRAAN